MIWLCENLRVKKKHFSPCEKQNKIKHNKTLGYSWAEGFSQVLPHKICTMEIMHTGASQIKHLDWKQVSSSWSCACAHLSCYSKRFSFPVELMTQPVCPHGEFSPAHRWKSKEQRAPLDQPWQGCWVCGVGWTYHLAVQELSKLSLDRWVVGRSWQLCRKKSELQFVMLLLKELNSKMRVAVSWYGWVACLLEQGRVCFLSSLQVHTKEKGATGQLAEGQNYLQEIPLQ